MIECEFRGEAKSKVSGTVLTADEMNAHNTFKNPERVAPVSFNEASLTDNKLKVVLPAMSVVTLELK